MTETTRPGRPVRHLWLVVSAGLLGFVVLLALIRVMHTRDTGSAPTTTVTPPKERLLPTRHDTTQGAAQPTGHDTTQAAAQPTGHETTQAATQPTGHDTTQTDAQPTQRDPTQAAARPKGALHYLWLGLSAGLLGLVLLLAMATVVVPKAMGATPLTILTSSMEPAFPPGTLIIVRPTPPEDIHVGDVVTYQFRSGDAAVVSHRVIGIRDSSSGGRTFTTQGDNNASPDPDVVPEQLRGVVWYGVPYVGWASTYLHGSDNRSWLVPAIAVLLLGYAAYMVAAGLLDARRKHRAAAPESASDAAVPRGGRAGR